MQFKLLTLALFASFFATGFTAAVDTGSAAQDIAPIVGGLTKEQKAFIKPITDSLSFTDLDTMQAKCLFDTVSTIPGVSVDGQPAPSQIVDEFYDTKVSDLVKCVYPAAK
ncbi:hypothetical protein BCV72DRAFT_231724 [Rhizopus microsporus var. microsporus]|uniref:Uncharacterized protein n=1 Tax=Rhizopus microsporus var. microsporus TaxID=86635 RepID=A0A1X0QX54_RHIZD|nr:hypothetical protein BCV72DRAFT_231724 [Rhizopus microsporus var. microsporus]